MIKPLGHRVLVKPDIVEEKTKGGLYIPVQAKDAEQAGIDRGEVIEIGETCWVDERLGGKRWCKVGDRVIWARYAGKPIVDSDEVIYHLINDEDILAKEE